MYSQTKLCDRVNDDHRYQLNGEANLNRFSAVLAYKYKKFWVIETDTIKIRKQQSTANRIVVFFFDKAREKKIP